MEYNFNSISIDAIDSMNKKSEKVCEKLLDEIINFIRVLNDQEAISHLSQISTEINDLLVDQLKIISMQFTQTVNKVHGVLGQYL